MQDVEPLISKAHSVLERYRRYLAFLEQGEHLGDPEENWPRIAETKVIQSAVLILLGDQTPEQAGWRLEETYQEEHAGAARRAYRANKGGGVASVDYRALLIAEAKATTFWLRDTIDLLEIHRGVVGALAEFEQEPVRTILFLTANTPEQQRFDFSNEVRDLELALRLSANRDRYRVVVQLAARPLDLIRLLGEVRPTIVHFSAHGASVGGVYLHGDGGTAIELEPAALANLFKLNSKTVECVLFNACYSDYQAREVRRHIPHVIGVRGPIADPAALVFSQGFYTALGNGDSYEMAFMNGNIAVDSVNLDRANTTIELVSLPEDQ